MSFLIKSKIGLKLLSYIPPLLFHMKKVPWQDTGPGSMYNINIQLHVICELFYKLDS